MGKSRNQARIDSRASSDRRAGGRQPPPNYFSRKEQYRLLALCATLMFVLAMMNEARKPSTWKWLWGTSTVVAPAPVEPIDTQLREDTRTLPPDGFVVSEVTGGPIPPSDTDANFLPGIRQDLLGSIKDNTVMRVAENEVWQTMFSLLREKPQEEIISLSTANVGFAQLFRQTEFYRGRLITVRGTTRRVEPIQARDSVEGIEHLYRWIIAPGGSNSPIVIYSIEKPAGIALGDGAREEVEFTGFCFKRWAYEAGDGTRVAPLILAKTATWQPPPPTTPFQLPSTTVVLAVVVGLVGLSTIIALAVYRSSVTERPEVHRLRHSVGGRLHELSEDEILPSTGAALKQLADTHEDSQDEG